MVITDLMLDVVCVKALKKNGGAPAILPAESELLLGFQDALRNYDFSSAFIFSMQLYCDIRYILEETVVHSFEQLQKTAETTERRLPLVIDRAIGPRFELRRAARQRQVEVERFMLSDVVMEGKLPRYLGAGLEVDDVDEFFLLKHEPVWAGLLEFRAKLVMKELGHEFVNRSFLVEAAAYLYAAARVASKRFPDHEEFPVWVDMDKFLASYADDSALKRGILSGGDDPVAIIKKFKDIMPENVMDPKPSNPPLDEVPGQVEDFKQSVRIPQHLSKRYASVDRENQFFMEYMRGLIQQRLEPELDKLESSDEISAALQEISGNKHSGQLPETRRELAAERRGLRQKQQRRRALLAQLSLIQQFQILEDMVTKQLEGLLSIDFMALFNMSWAILFVVGMDQSDKGLVEKLGLTSGPKSGTVDRSVRVPLILGEYLSGDPDKDETMLHNVVRYVKSIVEGGADKLFEEKEKDWEDESIGDDSED